MTVDDFVIAELADAEAALLELNRQLVDLVADLTFDNVILHMLYERELFNRIHGDATIKRLRNRLHRRSS